jgi:hypothetical protein
MCFVGSGEGMGTRRAGATANALEPWVARAGVAVRARVTGVRVFAGLADTVVLLFFLVTPCFRRTLFFTRRFDDLAAEALRATTRVDPLTFLRDFAAFNCFPLFGLWPGDHGRHPGTSSGPSHYRKF